MIDYYNPDIVSADDYYPFGMVSRHYGGLGYRFGFNGKENDKDVKGYGNQQDYGMRIYDPRLGRFLSVDPLRAKYPELTPYQFASNRPIDGIDLDGLEWELGTVNSNLKEKGARLRPASPVTRYFKPWNPSDKSFTQNWRDSKNILANISYDIVNGLYTLPQQLTASIRNEDYIYNIGGNAYKAHGIEGEKQRLNNFVNGATTLVPGAAASKAEKAVAKYANKVLIGIENEVTQQVAKLTPLETKIINEANTILNSKEFEVITKAYKEGVEATITVGKRTLHYSPDLPDAGLTLFTYNEFIIGAGAFKKSASELGKTVLHELYRLYNQAETVLKNGGAAGEIGTSLDKAPREFAEKASQYLNK